MISPRRHTLGLYIGVSCGHAAGGKPVGVKFVDATGKSPPEESQGLMRGPGWNEPYPLRGLLGVIVVPAANNA